jgi:tetratricopeptide (TPR) repeat protein
MATKDTSAPLPRPLLAAAAVVALLHAAALLLPWQRVWGFDMLRYLQLPASFPYALLLAAVVAGVLWLTARKTLKPAVGSAILLAALLLAPGMDTFFYGDGPLLIPQVHRYSVTGEYDTALMLNLKSSPLAGALLTLLMTLIPKITTDLSTALYPFFWLSKLSLLAAGITIIALTRGTRQVHAVAALAGSAGVLLLMGEVEFYAPVFAAVAVYVVAGERAARDERAVLWPAVAAFVMAVFAHYMAVVLLPSLLYVIARRKNARVRAWTFSRVVVISAALIGAGQLLYVAMSAIFPYNRVLMPLGVHASEAGVHQYRLYSLEHIGDMFNLLVLLAPLALAALLLYAPPLLRRTGPDPESGFHALVVPPFFIALFFMNTSLGLARDWDLAAAAGIALLLAAVSLTERSGHRHAAAVLIGLSVLLQLPWLLLHEQPQATAERFEAVISLDDENMYGDYALSGYDALRKFDYGEGDRAKEIALTQRMIELVGYPQHYRELTALAQAEYAGRPDSLLAQLDWMLQRLARKSSSLGSQGRKDGYAISIAEIDSLAQAIGMIAVSTGERPGLRARLMFLAQGTRAATRYPAVSAMEQYTAGRYDSAAAAFERALRGGFSSPSLYLFFGNALALSGQYSASLSRFEEGVRRYPDDGMLRFTLGKYYVRAGIQPQRAAELLLWCVENGRPAVHVDEARALLRQLGQ